MSLAYGEQQRQGSALGASGGRSQYDLELQYQVVLQDTLGHPALGFRDGTWYRLTVSGPQALQLRGAIRTCPHAAGSIVQIACWWMRENPTQNRALDLATELALTVGELVRACPADGLGSTSMDLLPAAMAAVAQSPAAALPAATASGYSSSSDGAYGGVNGYSSPSGYSSTDSSTGGYASSNGYGDASGYGDANGSTGGYSTGSYAATPDISQNPYAAAPSAYAAAPTASRSSYAATPAYPADATYDAAAAAMANGWFEPADGTGTGGFPKIPPAPVLGRQAALSASAPTAPQPYLSTPVPAPAPSQRGYNGAAQPQPQPQTRAQTALPAPTRGYGEAADWEPRPAAPRRPSHQPHPQQAAPRPAPAAANGQPPRQRPAQPQPQPQPQPRDDFERRLGMSEQPDLGRSSDRNPGVPPRRPSAAPGQPRERGTMGQRPASRPRRPAQ
ncbi:MAG: hypothetical protein ACJ786_02770 [Catenulispora sp.]